MRQFCLFVLALLLGAVLASTVSAQQGRSPQPYYTPQKSQFQNSSQNFSQSLLQRQSQNQLQRQFPNQLRGQNSPYQGASSIVKRYTFSPQDLPQNTFSREPSFQREPSFSREPSFQEAMPRETFTEEFADVQRDDNRPFYSGTFIDPVPVRETVGPSFNDSYFSCRCYDEWTGFCTCPVGLSLDKDRCCGPRGCGPNQGNRSRGQGGRGRSGSHSGGCGGGGCR